jgi:hypothetical protein
MFYLDAYLQNFGHRPSSATTFSDHTGGALVIPGSPHIDASGYHFRELQICFWIYFSLHLQVLGHLLRSIAVTFITVGWMVLAVRGLRGLSRNWCVHVVCERTVHIVRKAEFSMVDTK